MELAEKMRTGRPVGGWLSLPSPSAAELLAGQGFDFVAVDTEHAPSSPETVENAVRAVAAAPGEAEALVRVAENDPVRIKRALDAGPAGLMAPRIDDAADARELVRSCRYPPQGDAADEPNPTTHEPDPTAHEPTPAGSEPNHTGPEPDPTAHGRRGVAATRASDYGATLDAYVREEAASIATVAQVETGSAADAAGEIGAVPGIDALFVGPADLSASLGCFREFDDPAFRDAVDRTLAGAADAGVPVGTLATSLDGIDRWLDAGFDFLIAGTDAGFIASGAQRSLDRYDARVDR